MAGYVPATPAQQQEMLHSLGYADWEAKRTVRRASNAPKKASAVESAPPPPKGAKLSFKDQRDFDELPKRIEKLDAMVAKAEAEMADPALYTKDPARFQQLMAAVTAWAEEKDAAEMRWLELAEMVDALNA